MRKTVKDLIAVRGKIQAGWSVHGWEGMPSATPGHGQCSFHCRKGMARAFDTYMRCHVLWCLFFFTLCEWKPFLKLMALSRKTHKDG